MTTIAYDIPVKDYIGALSATGHVTHKSYKKTSVTLHHNGGRLSHEGVLEVWKTRPASAHFDIDGAGRPCQYVKVNEYAWAVGNTAGNMSTISIEMANSSVAPKWEVSEVTWKAAARLAGWLFAKVIGARPSKSNFFYHHNWSSTACAGPFMDSIYNQVLAEAQKAYDMFTKAAAPARPPASSIPAGSTFTKPSYPKLVVDGSMGPATITAWQRVMSTPRDGLISHPSTLVRAVQVVVGAVRDGELGPNTWRLIQRRLGVNQTGRPDAVTIRALQTRLNQNRF